MMADCYKALTRKKVFIDHTKTELSKVLTTFDLCCMSIGATLGIGVYILAGQVSQDTAGPAVVLSFAIAALASVFSALCYAEFGVRVPKAGSAYIYSYVTVGEFIAYLIGWNLILEYAIGTASVAKGFSNYLDELLEKRISTFFLDHMKMDIPGLGKYPDFLTFGIIIIVTIALSLGAKDPATLNNVLTMLNVSVILFVIIGGSFYVDPQNWFIPQTTILQDNRTTEGYVSGKGGFMPYGFGGVIKGAATCFFGFVGFDIIATAGEEAKTPQRSIPLAIFSSLIVIFIAYFGISIVITMMIPYYLQNKDAPLPHAFELVGFQVGRYIVLYGAVFALCTALFGASFPLPRVVYAMASDGLLFAILGKVHPRFKTPFVGTWIAGMLTAILAAIFDLNQLVDMMSIGTLMAYTIVGASVLLLRYDVDPNEVKGSAIIDIDVKFTDVLSQLFNLQKFEKPTILSSTIVGTLTTLYSIFCLLLGGTLNIYFDQLERGESWVIITASIFAGLALVTIFFIIFQPKSKEELTFATPWIPLVPALSIIFNIYLMTGLDKWTWMRFVVWIIIGFIIYFGYSVWNSKERYPSLPNRPVPPPADTSTKND